LSPRPITYACRDLGLVTPYEVLKGLGDSKQAEEATSLYLQLCQLVADIPELGGREPITAAANSWLGRASYLVGQTGNIADKVGLDSACEFLIGPLRDTNVQIITSIVHRALAYAEATAPTAFRGGFIGVRADIDALQVVGKVLRAAQSSVLIVDPYMDLKEFTDFAPLAGADIKIKLLADSQSTKPDSLSPGIRRWETQFGSDRPLEVRLALPRTLHDRLIFVDEKAVWSLSQSLKDFAGRSPASVQRLDPDLAARKVAFYDDSWASATPVPS